MGDYFFPEYLVLFIYGLFNKALISSDCKASNGRVNNECLIGKHVEGSGRGLIQDTVAYRPFAKR
jgi:hypothetical protein